jgi:hypothetical protein
VNEKYPFSFLECLNRILVCLLAFLALCSICRMSGSKIFAPHSSGETHTPFLLSGTKYCMWVTGRNGCFPKNLKISPKISPKKSNGAGLGGAGWGRAGQGRVGRGRAGRDGPEKIQD